MKKYRRVMFLDPVEWCKVGKKTDSWFQKWHEEFRGFLSNHWKFKKFYFDELFLSNVYEVWAKKYRGVIFHDTEVIFQNLNQPWPCGFKNGMSNWVIFLFSFFFHRDSLHAKLNKNYKAWSYKKKMRKKIKVYRKPLQKEPTVNRYLLILDLKAFRS